MEEELFVGRERERTEFESVIRARSGNLALVGPEGSGKSTLINIALQRCFAEETVIRLKPQGRMTSAKVMEQFLEDGITDPSGDFKIVLLEDLERLFLRNYRGFEAFKIFLDFVAQEKENLLWIITAPDTTWRFLNHVFKINSYFQNVIRLSPFNHEEIFKLIEGRHRMSGYHLDIPEYSGNQRLTRFPFHRTEYPGFFDFFEKIERFTEGNPGTIIHFWKQAIDSVNEDHIGIIYRELPDLTPLGGLNDIDMILMKTILLHGSLTLTDIARIFSWKEAFSGEMANRLAGNGYLIKSGKEFRVHPFLQNRISRYLNDVIY
jgi:hypothetical protein